MSVLKSNNISISSDKRVQYSKGDYGWAFYILYDPDISHLESLGYKSRSIPYPTKKECIEAAVTFYKKLNLEPLPEKVLVSNQYDVCDLNGKKLLNNFAILRKKNNPNLWQIQRTFLGNQKVRTYFDKEIKDLVFNTRASALNYLEDWEKHHNFPWF